jgi:hypothetical protein
MWWCETLNLTNSHGTNSCHFTSPLADFMTSKIEKKYQFSLISLQSKIMQTVVSVHCQLNLAAYSHV